MSAGYGSSGSKRTRPDSIEPNETNEQGLNMAPVSTDQETTSVGSVKQSKRVRTIKEEAKEVDSIIPYASAVNPGGVTAYFSNAYTMN